MVETCQHGAGKLCGRDITPAQAMFECKVLECQKKTKHPWEDCIYCHPRENARRRDVTKHRYAAEACPDYAKDEYCELGDDCPYAHGTFEVHLHPAKYCTKMCTKGAQCSRKICFFAHSQEELREADFSFGPKNADEARSMKEHLMAGRGMKLLAEQSGNSQLDSLSHLQACMTNGSLPALQPNALPVISPSPLQFNFLSNSPVTSTGSSSPSSSLDFNAVTAGFQPTPLDLANLNQDNRALMTALDQNLLYNNMADCQSLTGSPLASLAQFGPPSPPQLRSPSGSSAPRMSVRKARELGVDPKKSRNNASPLGTRGQSLPPLQAPESPGQVKRRISTQWPLSPVSTKQNWMARTKLSTPGGAKISLEQAIRMAQYMDGLETGSLDSHGSPTNKLDWLEAIARLRTLGFKAMAEEDSEEERSSGISSPDYTSFSLPYSDSFSASLSAATQRFSADLFPGPQCAALLNGSGLNLSAGVTGMGSLPSSISRY